MVNLQEMDLWIKSYIPMGARNQFSDHDFLVHDYQFMIDIERKRNMRYDDTLDRKNPNYNILTDKTQALVPIFTFLSGKVALGAPPTHRGLDLGRKRVDQVLIPIYENFLRKEKLTAQQRQAESEAQRELLIQSRISGAAETRLSQRSYRSKPESISASGFFIAHEIIPLPGLLNVYPHSHIISVRL